MKGSTICKTKSNILLSKLLSIKILILLKYKIIKFVKYSLWASNSTLNFQNIYLYVEKYKGINMFKKKQYFLFTDNSNNYLNKIIHFQP